MKKIFSISLITLKELLHERVFYLIGGFAFLAVGLSLLLGDLTYAEQSKITLDFLLAGIELTNLLFSVFMGITLLHRELNLGWIAMVLSKPVSRTSFLLGKFLGQAFIQGLVILMMGLLTWGLCSMNEIVVVPKSLFQTLLLMFFEGIIMSSVVYIFAVNLGALLAAASSLIVYALGNFTEGAEKTNQALQQSPVWTALKAVIPNFRVLNMKTLAAYGISIEWNLVGILFLYTIVCCFMYFAAAAVSFSRRDIFT
jgi:ABC-type transport system involved in multi-copper enzyme maturation permease subunit